MLKSCITYTLYTYSQKFCFWTSEEWNTRLTAFFQDKLGKLLPEEYTILDFTEAEMMGLQWHQLGHMQAICKSYLTVDDHASTTLGELANP